MSTPPADKVDRDVKRLNADGGLGALALALAERYRIDRELGRGGMATVYLAEDLRHRRQVAIKVLHPDLGAAVGAERFLREIQVTASLHHPHVLPLHDSGEAAELLYYVMPYVEGESLRQRLMRERQLPVDDAVRIACDVASALDYAHRHGVVHRDTKPENILLQDGRAVVADFGIARAVLRAADARTLTGTGISVGTPQYMSPEQAAGEREVDGRTDIFALGCVIYEMLAGTPPFTAPTAQGVIAKVIADAPRHLSHERPAVPAHVAAAVMRALEKTPADRFSTAAQFAAALTAPGESVHQSSVTQPTSASSVVRRTASVAWLTRRDATWGVITAVAVIATAAAVAGRTNTSQRAAIGQTGHFTLRIADSQRLSDAQGPLAISPDGRVIVYVGQEGPGRRALYARRLDDLDAHLISGTEGALTPFFSFDGRWVGFANDVGELKKVPIGGGAVTPLGGRAGGAGRAWGPGDVIVNGTSGGLLRASAAGGAVRRLTDTDRARGELRHADPLFLPDGKTIAFRVSLAGDLDASRIGLVSLDPDSPADTTPRPWSPLEIRGGTPLGYVDGMLVVAHPDGSVTATPVDYRARRVLGASIQLLDQVSYNRGANAALSANGTLVYVGGGSGARLTIVDERGSTTAVRDELRRYQYPRFSPDGRRIAVQVMSQTGSGGDVWVHDIASKALSRVTFRGIAGRLTWTPDGKRLVYTVEQAQGNGEARWTAADGSGGDERFYHMPEPRHRIAEIDFSPVDRLAVLRIGNGPARTNGLWVLPLDSMWRPGSQPPTQLFETPFSEAMPRISPDGKWLAYISDETGRYEVYVRPFPGPGGRVQISTGGASEPMWAGARRLVYREGDRFVEATLAADGAPMTGSALSVAGRRVLFEGRYATSLPVVSPAQYDAHPQGRQFVVLRQLAEDREIVVVVNWLDEVRAKVAAARSR
jgi:eukaryotic-like serine/threonine-protein kinase